MTRIQPLEGADGVSLEQGWSQVLHMSKIESILRVSDFVYCIIALLLSVVSMVSDIGSKPHGFMYLQGFGAQAQP